MAAREASPQEKEEGNEPVVILTDCLAGASSTPTDISLNSAQMVDWAVNLEDYSYSFSFSFDDLE